MRKLDRSDLDTLRKLANYFIQKNDYSLAAKIYTSINDIKSMVDMHVNAGHWTDVAKSKNKIEVTSQKNSGLCISRSLPEVRRGRLYSVCSTSCRARPI